MRLLIATGLYDPDIGGPATYTKFLERHLPNYDFDLTVVAFTHVRKYPRIVRHAVYMWRLLRQGKDCDLIYALDTVSVGVPALLSSILLRKKLYLRVPGDYAWEQGQQRFGVTDTLDDFLTKKSPSYTVRFLSWLQYRVARRADRIVVPSEYMKHVVMKWGIAPHKIIRIYSAFNPVLTDEEKAVLRTQFGYDGFVITTSARLVPWKGIEALIDVCVVLRKNGMPVHLHIIGDGMLRSHLEAVIHKHNAESYIQLCGKVSQDELARRIKACDIFVLNTSYEGLSHQLLEVMSLGIPIVTTPVGGNVELIMHEKEGLLVPFNDHTELKNAIERLFVNTELRSVLVSGARTKVAHFSEDVIIADVLQLFK